MRSVRKTVIVLLVVTIFLVAFMPVQAYDLTPYPTSPPTEYEGIWNTLNNYGIETYEVTTYKLLLIFTIYNIETDADDYWIEINYDGVTPAWPWNIESLDVLYRWGMSGSWTHLVYLGFWPVNDDYDVTTATSSTFQIRFRGAVESGDGTQTTWYFEDRPTLWAYWE